jgi:two-component system CheB/CheR fusion protein
MAIDESSKLAASLAHEINNPLDSVLNLLYMIETEAKLTDKGREYLALASEEVQRVSQITHAALESYRDDGARNTNIPRLMRSVIDLYGSKLHARGISVRTRYCLGGEVPAFSGPMRQVFSNLLLNAAAAMPRGGLIHARAAVCHEWSGQHRRGLRLTFADSGCGIPVENMRRIFDPYFSTKGAGGNGLGLSLVQDVVKRHDGTIRVRSSTRPGHSGSVFAIFLPVA